MIEFQLTNFQYIKMMRAVMRRRLFINVPIIYGSLWIVGWILFAISGGDAWSDIGAMGVLLIAILPIAALFWSIWLARYAKRDAEAKFNAIYSLDGYYLDVKCKLEDGQVLYHNVSRDKLYTIDLKKVKKIVKFKDFFALELNKNTVFFVPLNTETENLYNDICNQRSALKNK